MPALSFQTVCKTYSTPRGPFQALDRVSLEIQEGEFFGLLGPNGAGKTTLISILSGLARASSGRVLVQGHDVQSDYAAARRSLGVVPQELVFDPFFNVRETLRIQSGYFGVKHNDDWIDELLQSLGLDSPRDAGHAIAQLQQQGAAALAALAPQIEALSDAARAEALQALAQLQAYAASE